MISSNNLGNISTEAILQGLVKNGGKQVARYLKQASIDPPNHTITLKNSALTKKECVQLFAGIDYLGWQILYHGKDLSSGNPIFVLQDLSARKSTQITKQSALVIEKEPSQEVALYVYSQGTCELQDAKIVFLGDNHESGLHDQLGSARGDLLAGVARSGDVVLIEGDYLTTNPSDSEKNQEFFNGSAPVKFQFVGWDNLKSFNKAFELEKSTYQLITKKESDKMSISQSRDFFLQMKEQAKSAQEQREEFLVASILKLRKQYPAKKIFVIAGDYHLNARVLDCFSDDLYCVFRPSVQGGSGWDYATEIFEDLD